MVLGDLTITNSTISNNTASATGTALSAAGGGAALSQVDTATLTNVSVAGNAATVSGAGGDGSAIGGGMFHSVGQSFVMSGGAISDNTASDIPAPPTARSRLAAARPSVWSRPSR